MKRKNIAWYLSLSLLFFVYACGEGGQKADKAEDQLESMEKDQKEDKAKEDQEEDKDKVSLTDDEVSDIINFIPSPIEASALLKESGAEFDESFLHDIDAASSYVSNYKKALNLGVYGANLGYINIYNEKVMSINYLNTVREIAEDLKVGQFFDFKTIQRLSKYSEDTDSLLYITADGFDRMNNYLTENDRGDVSVMVIIGGWVESLYLTTRVAQQTNHEAVIERIGEQKLTLEELFLLIENFEGAHGFSEIYGEMIPLRAAYSNIEIETVDSEDGESSEGDGGTLMVSSGSESKVNITKEDVERIAEVVNDIRAYIID